MKETVNPDPLLPEPLQPGDTIGLFSPSGPVRDMNRVKAGIAVLREMGFQVRVPNTTTVRTGGNDYLSDSDAARAGQLQNLWDDDTIKALMAVRGGYGCLRLLDRIDFARFKTRPKWLIGFSDLTVLLASMFLETGLIGIHGPVVSSLAETDIPSRQRLYALLTGSYRPYFEKSVTVLRSGSGRGRLVAGNLTTICHLLGTPWEPDLTGAVLLLEDTGEPMYRIDRMLTHLACAGGIKNLAGLILGDFDPGGSAAAVNTRLRQPLFERVSELTTGSSYPIWADFPVGHLARNQAVPYGMEVSMGSGRPELKLHPGDV